MAVNLKTATPDTTLPTTGFLFGADSQSASSPSVYPIGAVADALITSNLSAAAKAIVTAADVSAVFIYDTTRDTDGGAWRDKCTGKSWMTEALNTATRGATAKFPQRALIVGRNSPGGQPAVTIYDLTDPSTPAWMVFNGSSNTPVGTGATYPITSICATQGAFLVAQGNLGGLTEFDFITESMSQCNATSGYSYTGGIAARNSGVYVSGGQPSIAHATVNAIAATVLPVTQPNPLRCGLPNPTIAVGTAGGVSVIRADGVACNSSSTAAILEACFGLAAPSATPLLWTLTAAGLSVTSQYQTASWNIAGLGSFTAAQLGVGTLKNVRAIPGGVAVTGSTGLAQIKLDPANPANGAVAYATTTYSTGYMAGLTKLALAESSADLANMVGGTASDRSGAGNNPTVTGTITRSVVASGAELAAYGGFGTSNYIELPYAAAFDPGTGDVQVMAEVVLTSAIAKQVTFLDRIASGGGAYYRLNTDSSGKPRFIISDGTNVATALAPVALSAGAHCIRGIRRAASSRIELEVDGVIVATASASAVGSLNNASAVLRIGQAVAGGAPMDIAGPGIARVHVSMSAPTPDQIVAWWTAHSPQFASNAKSLIAGSTNVQGLAYDTDTDQLGIATAAGTNVFKGLVRAGMVNVAGVNDNAKLSNDNHKAVAFSGGDLVIASAAQVYGSLLATSGLREIAKKRGAVPAYDPTWGIFSGVTTDATPTIIASTPILEGRAYRFRATVAAVQYGGTATEKAVYDVTGIVTRDIGGNVVVASTTTTVSEVTASMDCVAQANTTAQTLEIEATGKASTRLAWCVELELYDIGLMGAAA